MERVLFICMHNSARSQMAEAFLNEMAEGRYLAESAGLEPTRLDSAAVTVMQEAGLDITGQKAKSVFDLRRDGRLFSVVITICDSNIDEECPTFPGVAYKDNWPLGGVRGVETDDERLERMREVRDRVKASVEEFLVRYGRYATKYK